MNKKSIPLKQGYDYKDGGLVFSLVIVAYLLINVVAAFLLEGGAASQDKQFAVSLGATVLVELCMLLIWFSYSRFRSIDYLNGARVNRELRPTKVIKTIVLIVAIFGFAILIEYFLLWFFGLINYTPHDIDLDKAWKAYAFVPVVIILPAICEEFVFRGVILSSLEGLGKWKAILISAALFALMHLNIAQTFYQFLLGVVLGYIVITFRTIWVGVIGHFLSNSLAIVRSLTASRYTDIIFLSIAAAALLLAIFYVWYGDGLKLKRAVTILTEDELEDKTKAVPHESVSPEINAASPEETKDTGGAETAAQPQKTKERREILMTYFGGVAISIIIWIVDLITNL